MKNKQKLKYSPPRIEEYCLEVESGIAAGSNVVIEDTPAPEVTDWEEGAGGSIFKDF
ncbi:hypothetical protein [Sphingobacterium sp. Mn56C]|uniref:hypothetical protein n=1 Tax=Sphingobacterium sp. Mn56C TaxID=3395261 RepID=UPI003BF48D18